MYMCEESVDLANENEAQGEVRWSWNEHYPVECGFTFHKEKRRDERIFINQTSQFGD